MKKLEDGHILIQSAIEARLIGRAAAKAMPNETMVTIKHDGENDPVYRNELVFLDRELKHGPLKTPTKNIARKALLGAAIVAKEGKPFHELTPKMAEKIIAICQLTIPVETAASIANAYPIAQSVELSMLETTYLASETRQPTPTI